MFGIGMPEFLLILVVALIVLGPKKLPELARSIGKGLAELKKSTEEIKENLNVGEEFKEVQKDLTNIIEPTQYLDPPLSPPLSEDREEKSEAEPAAVTPASFPKAPDA
jgi:Tat protein translocase TatB subunit